MSGVGISGLIANLPSTVTPYPTQDPNLELGGCREVATAAARDLIPANFRVSDMLVTLQDTGVTYQLRGGLTNADWVPVISGAASFIIRTDLADLTARDHAAFPNGCQAYVVSEQLTYQLDTLNPLTTSSPLIVARGAGTGKWYRKSRAYVVGNFTLWIAPFGYPGSNYVYGFTPGQLTASNTNEPDILLDLNAAITGAAAGLWDCNVDALGNLWVGTFDSPHPVPPNGKSYKFLVKDITSSGSPTPTVILSANAAGPSDSVWTATAFDGQNNLWVAPAQHGTFGLGIFFKYNKRSSGLTGSPVPDVTLITSIVFNDNPQIVFDSFGNLWSCSNFPVLGTGVIMISSAQLQASNASLNPAVAWGGAAWNALGLAGIGFDSRGDLWVSDYATNTLRCYDPRSPVSGNQVATKVLTSTAFTAGGLSAIAFDSSGNLWVCLDFDPATSKVLKIDKADLAASGAVTPSVVLQPPSVNALGLYLNLPAFPNNPNRSGLQPSGWPVAP